MIPSSSDFYGDDVRWFVGTVISINDPKKLGRVRVRIHGLHPNNTEDVKESDLPWAQSLIPVTEGGSSGIGSPSHSGSEKFAEAPTKSTIVK